MNSGGRERSVLPDCAGDVNLDLVDAEFFKRAGIERECIGAHREIRKGIIAGSIRGLLIMDAGCDVGGGYCGVLDDSTRGVVDATDEGPCRLAVQGYRDKQGSK